MTNVEQDFIAQEGFDTEVEAPEAAATAKDERVWTLDDGTEVSMSEFVREQFQKHNKSRREISEEFDINYRTVYGATQNMTNDAEPASRGRAASNPKILVTPEGDVVTGNETEGYKVGEEDYSGDVIETDRNSYIKEQVEAGKSRGDVASALGISYGVVYNLTKGAAGATQRHEVEYNGEMISRSEYIRIRFQEGLTRAEIAKELDVDYPVVWGALKSLKSETDKFQEQIERLEKFADKVDPAHAEDFGVLIAQLKEIEVLEADEAKEEATDAEESVYAE